MVRRASFAIAAVALLHASSAAGQDAPADSTLRAGARASRVVIDPFPVSFTRGDSTSVRISLVDSVGTDVTGAGWSLETDGGVINHRLIDSVSGARRYGFSAVGPGSQTFWVTVQRPGPDGRVSSVRLDSLVATATDWAVARLEILQPEYSAYSGTTIRLRAKAYGANGTELEEPRLNWETDDPCHARIMPDGAISFGAPAKITVKVRSQGKEATREIRVSNNPVSTMDISPSSAQTRVGDVVKFRVGAEDRRGQEVRSVAIAYTVASLDSGQGSARIDERGFFVAEQPGSYVVRVSAGDVGAEALVEVGRRPSPTPVHLVGRGSVKGAVSRGLAVFTGKDARDYAYTTTESGKVYAWDVTDPTRVTLSDSVTLDAAVIGDIKISGDGGLAVVARSGGFGARNGITVLDLGTPAHPKVSAAFSDNLIGGVEKIWLQHSLAYLTNAGAGSLDIVDLSNPAQPRYVGRWETRVGQQKKLHDVWGDNKQLYLAYGVDGLVILDIDDKGTPTNPVLLSQIKWKRAAAHSVARAGRYAYVGEEILGCDECISGPRGAVRIIDVTKIKEPVEVARYEVPEAGADRITVENSTLFAAFRQGGVRLVDVTGELRGDLYREGRQVGWFMTTAPDSPAMASVAVSFKGYVFVIDANSGLWVVRHQRTARLSP